MRLFVLASRPSLAAPGLRTIGIKTLLVRLDKLLGDLPLSFERRRRIVDCRNGAMHVGTSQSSRHVLVDSLTLCQVMLRHLGESENAFFGEHHQSVVDLLDAKRSEVGHRVAAKRARAQHRLADLKERLGAAVFEETRATLEARAPFDLEPDEFGDGLIGVDQDCPECGDVGRLVGRADVDFDVDFDVEPMGGGRYEPVPYSVTVVTLSPEAFGCNVCRLRLVGPEELAEAGLPSTAYQVAERDLGPDFDITEYYGFDPVE